MSALYGLLISDNCLLQFFAQFWSILILATRKILLMFLLHKLCLLVFTLIIWIPRIRILHLPKLSLVVRCISISGLEQSLERYILFTGDLSLCLLD